jgi:protein-tyrosine kinase
MGRVDDAMRRAAEAVGSAGPAGIVADVGEDLELLLHEKSPGPEPFRPDHADHPDHHDGLLYTVTAPAEDATASSAVEPVPNSIFSHVDWKLAGKVVADPHMAPACREQYRRLAATLHHMQVESNVKVVMIASPAASEGKSLTVANLALTFSESYKRQVLLIDADLRRPTLHTTFKIDARKGLSDILTSIEEPSLQLHAVSPRLAVLPAGRPSHDPMAGLTSGWMRRVVEEARAGFDWVIIDTPPVGLLPDANLLARMADGVLLVVRADVTPFDMVQRSVEAIGRDRILGVVLNGTTARRAGRGYYQYYDHYHRSTLTPSAK